MRLNLYWSMYRYAWNTWAIAAATQIKISTLYTLY